MFALVLPSIVLLPALRRRAPQPWRWLGLALLISLTLTLGVSCGGSSTPPRSIIQQGTTPGSYPVMVTASSSGSLAGTWTLTLTVTP
jgi:hypothetical protein